MDLLLFIVQRHGVVATLVFLVYAFCKKKPPGFKARQLVKVPQGGRRWKRGVAVITDKNLFNLGFTLNRK
jgi:hypothetical protein